MHSLALDISMISDNQAEAGVIATLVYHPEFILHTDYLKPSYFYNVENGCIYWAIQELYKNGVETIDALNITNMLNSNGAVKKKIEQYNLTDMQEFISMSQYACRHSIEEYKLLVNNVVTMSFKRDLNKISVEIQSKCFNSETNLGELNSIVNSKINKLTEQYISTNEINLFGNRVEDLWKEVCDRRTENGVYGIPSKFERVNDFFTYEPGELVLLKARMKRGKSAFFMNEAIHKIKNGVPTLFFDTEMQDRLFYERMLANLTGIEVKRIKTGRYSHDEDQVLAKANEWIKKQPFVHIYVPQTTDEEIYATHKILKYKMGLEFSIFDYIKSNILSSSENYNALGARCDFLKNNVAGELNIAMLAGAQLNRSNQVADSDKLERYVSASMLWRDKTSEEIAADTLECGNYALTIDLNRMGEQMDEAEYIDFKFDGNRMRIEQAKQHKANTTPFSG
jgi:replicative DNA helicase